MSDDDVKDEGASAKADRAATGSPSAPLSSLRSEEPSPSHPSRARAPAEKSICEGCVFAKWNRTNSGKLHPDGSGRCQYVVEPRVIPASMYFLGIDGPPLGGHIIRKSVGFSKIITECPTFRRPSPNGG